MRWHLLILSLILVFLAACVSAVQPAESEAPDENPASIELDKSDGSDTGLLPDQSAELNETDSETAVPGEANNCPGPNLNPVAQAIDEDFETATYDDVMAWFCAGAEFEDIVLALETESLTGAAAEELLILLSDGLDWEEIWFVVGLDE